MNRSSPAPLVLDTDESIGPLPHEQRVLLPQAWREAFRFGCSHATYRDCIGQLEEKMPAFDRHGTVFFGSGDFHHLSLALIERCQQARCADKLTVVVLDNHPDNMRFPWGIHCGSWVSRAAQLPGVEHVHVIGVTSGDLSLSHAWEHRLSALRAGKLTYWCTGVDTQWATWLGLGERFRQFADIDALAQGVTQALARSSSPVYFSVDKDVFAPEVVRTNWDQGQLQVEHFDAIVQALSGRIVGSDVTGEVSTWHYQSAWKRWLSAADGQDTANQATEMRAWQARQTEFNQHILQKLRDAVR